MSATRGLAVDRPFAVDELAAPFVAAGVLVAADVHVARVLCRLADVGSPLAGLAVAFAARGPRVGHACLDVDALADTALHETAFDDGGADPAGLPWPDPDALLDALRDTPLVVDVGPDDVAPLVVSGRRVHLRRYHDHEQAVAADLLRRATHEDPVDAARRDALLDRLFPDAAPDDPQRRAAHTAASRRLTVLAGGPGTGKTWTVARILAVLVDQAERPLEVALVAPTGKAAARLDEGLREALDAMDVPGAVHEAVAGMDHGQTIHRLLGRRTNSRFWHDRDRPLPHDVVVVDETSMTSLSLMRHLLDAIRPEARVVLVGDPDQLASVEAGNVLADVVRAAPERDGPPDSDARRSGVAAGIVVLQRPRRFGADSGIGRLARAIRAGDADAALDLLSTADDLAWRRGLGPEDLADVRSLVVDRAVRLTAAARAGDVAGAFATLGEVALLCGHRRGRDGVAGWQARVDDWLGADLPGWRRWDDWQPGRIVLATTNDRLLGVFNGDLGVVVATDEGPRVAFHPPGPGVAPVAPARLEGAEPTHALTIHKSQGSQWGHVVVSLPSEASRVLTRELLYTAVTRAAERLTVIGREDVLRAAIARPVRRASGLADRLADHHD